MSRSAINVNQILEHLPVICADGIIKTVVYVDIFPDAFPFHPAKLPRTYALLFAKHPAEMVYAFKSRHFAYLLEAVVRINHQFTGFFHPVMIKVFNRGGVMVFPEDLAYIAHVVSELLGNFFQADIFHVMVSYIFHDPVTGIGAILYNNILLPFVGECVSLSYLNSM